MFSIQAGALLDLRNRRMGQTHILHTTVNISTLPACFLQSHFQMLTDAAAEIHPARPLLILCDMERMIHQLVHALVLCRESLKPWNSIVQRPAKIKG